VQNSQYVIADNFTVDPCDCINDRIEHFSVVGHASSEQTASPNHFLRRVVCPIAVTVHVYEVQRNSPTVVVDALECQGRIDPGNDSPGNGFGSMFLLHCA